MSDDPVPARSTLADLVAWTERQFAAADLCYGHGTECARDEAAWLVLGGLRLPHDVDPGQFSESLSEQDIDHVIGLVRRRIETRLPVAYLLNEAWFAGLPFYVDTRVLIPRSPIAELIEDQFAPWMTAERVLRILDIGTGSGCIAIACALAFPHAEVDATDISAQALTVAGINVERYGLQEQVTLIESDVFNALDPQAKKYDLIVSNPPYVDAEDMAALTAEYRHEPGLALRAGTDGLEIVKRILRDAARYLSEQGLLVVEVGNSYAALLKQYPQVEFTWPEFEHGGHGIFILTAQQVRESQSMFA